ncbi:Bug family tripartite tricarboxylate transporter substrate binding protein [Reyranella sp.]|uniref:Bug family tripartite tricarboxylate transporter substrate binding protein n=1 Tax=Reyranella sp. TaxID=1929291 RepID=UPI003D147745
MTIGRRKALTILAAASAAASPARAQSWPTKPLTIVVPYAAGSATDTLARLMAEQLAPRVGQPVIVDNKGGGNGSIAANYVAKSAPDGYTLMIATAATHAGNPNLMKSVPYDSLVDFAPAGFYGFIQFVLLVRADAGMDTLADFIKRAKAKPTLTSGAGTPSARVITATLAERIGTEITYVPYKSAPQALADLLSGQIDMTFADVAIAVPQVKAGKVKALVMASDSRSPLLPEVPTFQEAGLGQFALDAWFVIMAPAKTPPEIVARIDTAVQQVVTDPEVIKRLRGISFEPQRKAPEDVRPFIKSEIEKWGRHSKAAGIEKE